MRNNNNNNNNNNSNNNNNNNNVYTSGFMKTVLKTADTKIAGMFLGNRSDSVHKYNHVHVVLRVLSTSCALHRSYASAYASL